MLAVLFALFTGLGALLGLIFNSPWIGAGIGFLLPTIWCVATFLFLTVGFKFIDALFSTRAGGRR